MWKVASGNLKGGSSQVHYQDGDKETLYLSQERVRLYMSAKEDLPAPTVDSLRLYALGLQKEAMRLSGTGSKGTAGEFLCLCSAHPQAEPMPPSLS